MVKICAPKLGTKLGSRPFVCKVALFKDRVWCLHQRKCWRLRVHLTYSKGL